MQTCWHPAIHIEMPTHSLKYAVTWLKRDDTDLMIHMYTQENPYCTNPWLVQYRLQYRYHLYFKKWSRKGVERYSAVTFPEGVFKPHEFKMSIHRDNTSIICHRRSNLPPLYGLPSAKCPSGTGTEESNSKERANQAIDKQESTHTQALAIYDVHSER